MTLVMLHENYQLCFTYIIFPFIAYNISRIFNFKDNFIQFPTVQSQLFTDQHALNSLCFQLLVRAYIFFSNVIIFTEEI